MLRLVYNGISKHNEKSKLKCSFMGTPRYQQVQTTDEMLVQTSSKGFLHGIRHAAIVKNEAEKDSPEFGKVTFSLTDKFRTNKVDGAGRK